MGTSKRTKHDSTQYLARRLAESFEPEPWADGGAVDFDQAGSLLGGLDKDEVKTLVATGLLAGDLAARRVEVAGVVRFLEAHPWWLSVRARKHLEHLRSNVQRVQRAERRSQISDEELLRRVRLSVISLGKRAA